MQLLEVIQRRLGKIQTCFLDTIVVSPSFCTVAKAFYLSQNASDVALSLANKIIGNSLVDGGLSLGAAEVHGLKRVLGIFRDYGEQ